MTSYVELNGVIQPERPWLIQPERPWLIRMAGQIEDISRRPVDPNVINILRNAVGMGRILLGGLTIPITRQFSMSDPVLRGFIAGVPAVSGLLTFQNDGENVVSTTVGPELANILRRVDRDRKTIRFEV